MAAAFLYCIGAAKAGTTWLSKALRAHPQAAMPPIKETHYFDSLELRTSIWSLDQLLRVRTDARAELAAADTADARTQLTVRVQEIDRWIALVGAQRRNDALYQNLMNRRLLPHHRLVADVTPAYALLKEKTFRRMAGLNDGKTQFLMILRDPIDRIWSNISMTAARRVPEGRDAAQARQTLLDEVLANPDNPERARSDYAGTLARLEQAVPARQRLVLFFEDLFDAETRARLSAFLGLDTVLQGPDGKINRSTAQRLAPADRSRLATLLRPQYDDIRARLGALPPRWQDNLAQSMVTS